MSPNEDAPTASAPTASAPTAGAGPAETDPGLLRRLLSPSVAVAETTTDQPVDLFAEERDAIATAVERRRREFSTTRGCARRALHRLGHTAVGIPRGPAGDPIWPPGVVGSLTHCDNYRAAAVGIGEQWSMIGIDAEPHAPLPPDVSEMIITPLEHEQIQPLATGRGLHADRIVFSAKESVYKALYPLLQCWIGFEDVAIILDPEGSFVAVPATPSSPLRRIAGEMVTGRWTTTPQLIVTAVFGEPSQT